MALYLIIEQQTIVGAVYLNTGETYTPPEGRQLVPIQPTSEALPMTAVELEQRTSDPASPINGQIWYNNAASEMRARINGVTKSLGAAGGWPLGNVITVHPTDPDADFTTITAACAAATAGDVILVAPSIYNESVTVPAQVDLVGLFAGKNSSSPPIIQFTHTTSGATVTLGNYASLINFKVLTSSSTNSITVSAVSVGNGTIDGCNITARNTSAPAAALNLRGITKTGSATTLQINHSYTQVQTSGAGTVGTAYAFYDDTSVIVSLGDANEFFDSVSSGTHAAMLFNNASCNIMVYGSNYAFGDILLTSYQTLAYRGGCLACSTGITGLSDQSDNTKLFIDEKTYYMTNGGLRMFKAALRNLTSDPSDAANGDVWYNSTDHLFRMRRNGATLAVIDDARHKALADLIHFIDNGPADGFASGAYREALPAGSVFPTTIIWWTSSGKTIKIVEKAITWSGAFPTTIAWKMYDAAGSLLVTATDTYDYTGGNQLTPKITRAIT